MTEPKLLTELESYGLGVALSPIHLVLLLLLSIGDAPKRRGGLLTLGHGLLLDMSHGSKHRTGLDLIAGGALVALPLPLLLFAKTAGVIKEKPPCSTVENCCWAA